MTAEAAFTTAWQNNGVFVASNNPHSPKLINDGEDGAIIVWYAPDVDSNIYAQRVDATGVLLWGNAGQLICSATHDQVEPRLVSDGAGGAIIVWTDFRNGADNDIYAQRVDASGKVLWQANGIPIAVGAGDQVNPMLVSDGEGGAIVVWQDARSGNEDIYAQRIGKDGVALWADSGIAVIARSGPQTQPVVAADGTGGALVAWQDVRIGSDIDIYAQRLSADGALIWPSDGVSVCASGSNQVNPVIASDASGGAIIAWVDEARIDADIYAQRIDAAGTIKWPRDGVAICNASGNQSFPCIIPTKTGGAVISWTDNRISAQTQVFAQQVDSAGSFTWQKNGILVSSTVAAETAAVMERIGENTIISWIDGRAGLEDLNIYAQLINDKGEALWPSGGAAIVDASRGQAQPDVVAVGEKSAIFAWVDGRSGTGAVFAQRVEDALFTDVTTLHWASDYINALAEQGIVAGYPTGMFYADRNITRAEFAKMIVLAIGEDASSAPSSFTDVADDFWAAGYIKRAKELGIIEGYPDGSFRPQSNISRQEIAKIVILAGEFTPESTYTAVFSDVPESLWSWPYILEAQDQAIVSGYPDGTFRPTSPATRAEASKMVSIMMDILP